MSPSRPPQTVENLVELLRWRAEVAPASRGFRFLENGEGFGEKLSYAELDRRAQAVAGRISEVLEPGDRALLLYPPSLDYVEAFFGCLYAGVIAVPAYPPNPARLARTLPRLQSIVADAGAKVALATGAIAGMAQALGDQDSSLGRLEWIATDEIDDELSQAWKAPDLSPESVAFLQYTSGSTGKPKGVVLDHRTLLKNEQLIQSAFGSTEEDVGVNWLPLYHDMGLIGAVIQPVYCGCESVLMSPLDFLKRPARWVEAISRFGGTVSTAPNFGYDLSVRKTSAEIRDQLDLSQWRVACNGAEPIRLTTLDRFAAYFEPAGFDRKAFMPAYGLAEVALIVSALPNDEGPRLVDAEGRGQVSCGSPLGDFDLRVVTPGTRREVPAGEVGELWLRGGSVAPGYWEKEGVNAEVFGARLADGTGPFLRTGDLGAMIDGELVVTGRLKDLIVIRGANHYPQDIESTVESVDPVIRPGCGAAFGVKGDDGAEELVVVQEVKGEAVDDVDRLIGRIREAIATVHRVVPREVVLIEARTIEKTSSGKIQRFAARKAYENDQLKVVGRGGGPMASGAERAATDRDSTRSAIEAWLVARVAEASGLDGKAIKLDAPFASYGIDSAEAVGIVGELEQWLECSLSATALYDFPTIAALAAHLSEDHEEARQESSSLKSSKRGGDEKALAIVGMACRFPGADGVEAFWELLQSGDEAIVEVSDDRWKPGTFTDPDLAGFDTMVTDKGGFLDDISQFDASFFGISPREARAMDPQQRLAMETAWYALEDAGLTREALDGSATGVFIGQSGSDFARLYQGAPVRAGSGLAPAITANRLSFWLNLKGPSATVDTACSSSLVALDQAMLNLRAGRCDAAIVGGVNAILAPDMSVAFSQARMLSPRGQCRAFDEGADGYVRGEGCGVVVVKRLSDALADGDRICAVIRGGAINQDGRTNGLTAPSGPSQQEVVRAALDDAGVEASTVDAVEAHGTGTELGDAIEVRALSQVFEGVDREEKIWLGSVKAQIGHLEAGAGVAGLIKAALVAERGVFPGQANFDAPNPACEFQTSPLAVPEEPTRLPGRADGAAEPRRIGVSSFGFGGTNAHFVVEEPPPLRHRGQGGDGPGLVALSAGDAEGLSDRLSALVDDGFELSQISPRDLGWSFSTRRDQGPARVAVVAGDGGELYEKLSAVLAQIEAGGLEGTQHVSVGFAFTGQGSQYVSMGVKLAEQLPRFRRYYDEALSAVEAAGCDEIRAVLAGGDSDDEIDNTEFAQPSLFALEVALARTLIDWGLKPDAVMGHSVGEFSAAHIAGDLSLEQAARLVVERGRRMQQLDGGGAMAAVFETTEYIDDKLGELGLEGIDIAAINGERHVVISGDADQISSFDAALDKEGVFVKPLSVSHAFHSGRMEPMMDGFFEVAGKVRPRRRQIDFVSALEGRVLADEEQLDGEYWRRHIRRPVRFAEAVEAMADRGVELVVEIGPRDTLSNMARRLAGSDLTWVATLTDGDDGLRRILDAAAQVWTAGAELSPAAVNEGGNIVDLPKTTYRRRRLWPDEDELRQIKAGD